MTSCFKTSDLKLFFSCSSSVFFLSLKTQSTDWHDFCLDWKKARRDTHMRLVTLSVFSYYFISCVIFTFCYFSSTLSVIVSPLFELAGFLWALLFFFSPTFADGSINRLIKTLRFYVLLFSQVVSDLFEGTVFVLTRFWYWSLNQVSLWTSQ